MRVIQKSRMRKHAVLQLAACGHAPCKLIELIPNFVILFLNTLELEGQAFNSPGGIFWQDACGVSDNINLCECQCSNLHTVRVG